MSLIIKVTRFLLIKKLVRIRLAHTGRVTLDTLYSTWAECWLRICKNWYSATMCLKTTTYKWFNRYFLAWHCKVSDWVTNTWIPIFRRQVTIRSLHYFLDRCRHLVSLFVCLDCCKQVSLVLRWGNTLRYFHISILLNLHSWKRTRFLARLLLQFTIFSGLKTIFLALTLRLLTCFQVIWTRKLVALTQRGWVT